MHGLKEEGEEKRNLITGIRGVGGRKTEEKEGKDKSEEIPDSHPQPGPWSRSEEVDRFCTRVFKKSNHNKVDLASFEPLGSPCLSLRPVLLPHQTVSALQGFHLPCPAFPWSVNTSEAASQSSPCVHPDSISAGREGWEGQTLPMQSSHWTGQQTASQEFALPSPPPQLRWRGSSCHHSLCW